MASAYASRASALLAADVGDMLAVPPRGMSWSAIIAGAVLALAAALLLGVLGVALGRIDATAADWTGAGARQWALLSGLVALFIGGLVAARLAAVDARFAGLLHGLVLWAFILVVSLTTLVGWPDSRAWLVGGLAQTTASAAPAAEPPTMTADEARQEVTRLLPDLSLGSAAAAQARARIIATMRALSPEASPAVPPLAAAQTARLGFAALLAGALAAAFGGLLARPRSVVLPNRLA